MLLFGSKIDFDEEIGELHLYIDFRKGSKFKCSICGADGLAVHDTNEKVWRHLNFFQYKAFIHYRNPRTICPDHGAHLVEAPWGLSGTGFALLFEAMVMQLTVYMSISAIATIVEEHDTRIWRIVRKHFDQAHATANYSSMDRVGIDEASRKKGHKYVTLFVDMDESKIVHVTEGKDSSTIRDFKEMLPYHCCEPKQIREFSADMSPAFKKGIEENFQWADVTFYKFHVIKLMNEAVDKVRRS